MNKGQISIVAILGIGFTVVSSFFGAIYASSIMVNEKIQNQASSLGEMDTKTLQRVSTLEEAVSTIKVDSGEIKKDIKEILRIIK